VDWPSGGWIVGSTLAGRVRRNKKAQSIVREGGCSARRVVPPNRPSELTVGLAKGEKRLPTYSCHRAPGTPGCDTARCRRADTLKAPPEPAASVLAPKRIADRRAR